MKTLTIKNLDDGKAYIDFNQIAFDKESQSVELMAIFPEMEGYSKRIEWTNQYSQGYFPGGTNNVMNVSLTAEALQTGILNIQCIAIKESQIIKYQIKSINVKNSLNVLANDTTVTMSVAEILQNQIDQAINRIIDLENRTLEDFPFGREE